MMIVSVLGGPLAARGGTSLAITAVDPVARTINASASTAITIHFDRPVLQSSIIVGNSIWAFGKWSGTVGGTLSFSNGDHTVTLTPDAPFSAGESVMVLLSHDLEAQDGTFLRAAGYSYQFWVRTLPVTLDFEEIAVLDTNIAAESSRPYGGVGSDVDGDGWLDLTMVNEDTSDLRVFLNSADGTGTFGPIVQPTAATGSVPSPSEPADFDRDGIVDMAIANTQGSSVSILLGQGDGTFTTQQLIAVLSGPRGIAVLDADGDGDVDIVAASASAGGELSILLNDGSGSFGPPSTMDGGGNGEWSLAAADMNEDGILDLVTGFDGGISVLLGTGTGTFALAETQAYTGRAWMLVIGDVNGDGHEDVAAVNTVAGQILMGDGTGQLSEATTYATDSFSLATDLGDLDGDGDLDWVTASFGGDWFLFTNAGDGLFAFDREFLAPAAASCSLMLDIDNDRDLDLALIDEIADTVTIQRNIGTTTVPALGHIGVGVLMLLIVGAATVIIRRRYWGMDAVSGA
jgi:hypothetical protein